MIVDRVPPRKKVVVDGRLYRAGDILPSKEPPKAPMRIIKREPIKESGE